MDDWITSVAEPDDEGETAEELANRWEVPIKAARERLQMLAAAGKLKVGKRKTTRIDGRQCCVPVYAVKTIKPTRSPSNRPR
jgi:hypothetical protein